MTQFNRFDIVEAYYLALQHCHGGMWTPEYSRMCSMRRYFKPSPLLNEDTLTENGKDIYTAVCASLLAQV